MNATPVSLGALVARINRKLAHETAALKILRGERRLSDLGNYFIIDRHTGNPIATHVDPQVLGRELGVLKVSKKVASGATP